MYAGNFFNINSKYILPPPNINIFPLLTSNNFLFFNQLNPFNCFSSKSFLPKILVQNIDKASNDNIQINSLPQKDEANLIQTLEKPKEQEKKAYFKVNYSSKDSLFTKTDDNSLIDNEEVKLLQKKRIPNKRKRKDNNDNIRKKIKRGFLNSALIKQLNDKLRSIGSKQYFEKFPQFFVSDIDQKRNKTILDVTLKDIFENEELYKQEKEISVTNYRHNLKVLQSEEIQKNEEFNKILNKTFRQLYDEYINSDEFKTGEIERLKQHKMDDDYIKRYIYLSNTLIEFFDK